MRSSPVRARSCAVRLASMLASCGSIHIAEPTWFQRARMPGRVASRRSRPNAATGRSDPCRVRRGRRRGGPGGTGAVVRSAPSIPGDRSCRGRARRSAPAPIRGAPAPSSRRTREGRSRRGPGGPPPGRGTGVPVRAGRGGRRAP
jgi:hypothetical protein